jgi:TPR repeat
LPVAGGPLFRLSKEAQHGATAIAAYRVAIGINPDYAEVHSNLGNALREEGKIHCASPTMGNVFQAVSAPMSPT